MKMLVASVKLVIGMNDDETKRSAMIRLGDKLTNENIEVLEMEFANVCKIPRLDEEDA